MSDDVAYDNLRGRLAPLAVRMGVPTLPGQCRRSDEPQQ